MYKCDFDKHNQIKLQGIPNKGPQHIANTVHPWAPHPGPAEPLALIPFLGATAHITEPH